MSNHNKQQQKQKQSTSKIMPESLKEVRDGKQKQREVTTNKNQPAGLFFTHIFCCSL
jgi:hypothetical protein